MKLTAPELAERIKTGPVTILVTDFADPCGMKKIPRTVQGAYAADGPNGLGGWTQGRWQIYFGGPYLYPPSLITLADWTHQVSDLDPADPANASGPCDECRRYAARVAQEKAEQEAERADADSAKQERRESARQAGYDEGHWYASNVDLAGYPEIPMDQVPVPPTWADVAGHYLSGWDDGRQAYEAEDE